VVVSINGADLTVVDFDIKGSDERFCLGFDCGTGVDDSADEAPAAVCLSLPLPFFFLGLLDREAGGSSDATDSVSNWPGKMVGKATTMGATAPWPFDDVSAWTEGGCLEFFFFPFLFCFGGVESPGFAA